jgi:alanyl-tRNA synthetase
VSMGTPQGNKAFSVELCGGTHVARTGEIGAFKIVSEGALSSGVRRLEAVTGIRVAAFEQGKQAAAQAEIERLEAENAKLRAELETLGGAAGEAVAADAQALVKDNKRLQKAISDARQSQGAQTSDDDIKEIGGTKFIGKVLEGFPPKDLKPMADSLKNQIGSGVVALVATNDGKASIVVGVTDDLTARISAVDLVRAGSAALGGKGGGGRPDMAQAGGPDAAAANDGVAAIESALAG